VNVGEADRKILSNALRYAIQWEESVIDSYRGCADGLAVEDTYWKDAVEHSKKNIEDFRMELRKLNKGR
jgi:hypothetical protein